MTPDLREFLLDCRFLDALGSLTAVTLGLLPVPPMGPAASAVNPEQGGSMAYAGLFARDAAQAAKYAQFRPKYSADLYAAIISYMDVGPLTGRSAVDVATGSGQALEGLVSLGFGKLIGVDSSQLQLKQAPTFSGAVEYRLGDAHQLPCEDASVDLVTVAQALHWFDRPRFYAEAARVLKTDTGVLAAWTYDGGYILPKDGAADKAYQHILNGTLGPYWAAPRMLVENHYRDLEPMDTCFLSTKRVELHEQERVTLERVVGYVSSWSAYITYRKQHPDLPDPLAEVRVALRAAAGAQEGDEDSSVAFEFARQVTLVMARGPRKQ